MARISLNPPRTPLYRIAEWFTRRRFGTNLDPLAAVGHNPQVARTYAVLELQVERWHSLDRGLKDLAIMAAAANIGCSWCMDFGYWEATMLHHVPAEKIRAVPRWRDSDDFTELEQLVLEYAEAMTQTPPTVSDHLVDGLRRRLNDAQLTELTAIVAVENLRSRINAAFGLTSQGFKDRCELAPQPSGQAAQPAGEAAQLNGDVAQLSRQRARRVDGAAS
jgi:alkylhydroperoxidase family enzyme